ncbi:MAG TPA: hypothetical protein VLG71_02895, partial [Candidatus Limnocylindria bacterium]|nr:hypothetical protein [Candidatus Limnocylindria bacterium]
MLGFRNNQFLYLIFLMLHSAALQGAVVACSAGQAKKASMCKQVSTLKKAAIYGHPVADILHQKTPLPHQLIAFIVEKI